jgi:hypothetical protein
MEKPMHTMAMPAMIPGMSGMMPMGGMMPMMTGGMPMGGMMPMMMGGMPMGGMMMPMMMCKMSCKMTPTGMTCEITSMDQASKDMLLQACKQMTTMMGNGMPMTMMCGSLGMCGSM